MENKTVKKIFDFLEEKEGKVLPKKWVDLIRKREFIEKLKSGVPFTKDELNIEGGLNLVREKILELPDYLYVEGNLNLAYTNITSLPYGLIVDGNLNILGSEIISLPKGLEVGESFDLSHTYIESLPDDLYVGKNLWFRYSNITEIPENLYVGGGLDIEGTPLAERYTDEEIRKNKNLNKGLFNGNIIRS